MLIETIENNKVTIANMPLMWIKSSCINLFLTLISFFGLAQHSLVSVTFMKIKSWFTPFSFPRKKKLLDLSLQDNECLWSINKRQFMISKWGYFLNYLFVFEPFKLITLPVVSRINIFILILKREEERRLITG